MKREHDSSGMERYLRPTFFIDWDSSSIKLKASELTQGQANALEKAKLLFYFVRDEIKYNPYVPRHLPEHFRASHTLAQGEGFCIQKAVLLAALARAVGIPARLGFAVIRNNLLSEKIAALLRTNIITDHGYAELYLEGKWVKATPAFDLEMCQKNGIIPVEFDGRHDAKFHLYNREGKLHIEYLFDRGTFDDVPLEKVQKWFLLATKPEVRENVLRGKFNPPLPG